MSSRVCRIESRGADDPGRHFQNFLSLTQDAVAVGYRPRGETSARLVYVNEGFTELFGYTLDDVDGKVVSFLHLPEHWSEFVAQIEPHMTAGSSRFLAEARCVRSDSSTFWASLSILLFDEDQSGGRYSVAIYRDMSTLKERENAANAALHERDALLAEKDTAIANMVAAQTRLHSAMEAYP